MEIINNRDWLIRELARKMSFTQGDCKLFLDTLGDIFEELIINGQSLSVHGLFTLEVNILQYGAKCANCQKSFKRDGLENSRTCPNCKMDTLIGLKPGKSKLPFDPVTGFHPDTRKINLKIGDNFRDLLRPTNTKK